MRNNYVKKIIQELFGDIGLSNDYLDLLNEYGLTKSQGLLIKEETTISASYLPEEAEDYEVLLFIIDIFRDTFIRTYSETNNKEINLDKLDNYKPYEMYWQITKDQEKTKTIIKPYTGEDYLNKTFLEDLVSFNLLGNYSHIIKILINTPSNEINKNNIRGYFLNKFEEINLLDKIEEEHPQSMKEAINYLMHNLDEEYIEKIKNNEENSIIDGFNCEMWIRNNFGLFQRINSKLVYDCYCSKYNEKGKYKRIVLDLPDSQSDIILKELKEYIRLRG